MNRYKIGLLTILVCLFSAGALVLNFFLDSKTKEIFFIGMDRTHDHLQINTEKLADVLGTDVRIQYFDDEADLLKSVYQGDIDAYILNTFNYISNKDKLEGAKAILAITADYYFVANKKEFPTFSEIPLYEEKSPDTPSFKVGISETLISDFIMSTTTLKTSVTELKPSEIIKSLNDGLIELAVISKSDYREDEHLILKKASELGYEEDVLILTHDWIELETLEDLGIVSAFDFESEIERLPAEAQMMNIMTLLFNAEINNTRYYFDDLVFDGLR